MLLYYKGLLNGLLLLVLVIIIGAGYIYYVNFRRPANDPRKRDISPLAILLAPVTFPLLFFLTISIFIIRTIVFAAFLVLYAIVLAATHFVVRLIIIPLLKVSYFFLSRFQNLLEIVLKELEGTDRLKHIFLQMGLKLFILGNLIQLIALSI
jgi:hypothetical protein